MERDPELASHAARVAVLHRLANSPQKVIHEQMSKARHAMRQQDLDAVDPNRELPEEERNRRADFRRRERQARGGLASGRARRAAKAKAEAAAELNVLIDALVALNEEDAA